MLRRKPDSYLEELGVVVARLVLRLHILDNNSRSHMIDTTHEQQHEIIAPMVKQQ